LREHLVDGKPVPYNVRRSEPLEVELPVKGRGKKVEIDVIEGKEIKRYTFQT